MIVLLDKELLGSGDKFEQITFAKGIGKPMILDNEAKVPEEMIDTWFAGCNVVAIASSSDECEAVLRKRKIKKVFIT
jgi:hypothetical protein